MTKRFEFDRLRTEGTRVAYGSVWVRYLANPDKNTIQVGYALGLDVGAAVVRNKIRRRLRHVMHTLDQTNCEELRSGDYLIGLHRGTRNVRYTDLEDSVRKCLVILNENLCRTYE